MSKLQPEMSCPYCHVRGAINTFSVWNGKGFRADFHVGAHCQSCGSSWDRDKGPVVTAAIPVGQISEWAGPEVKIKEPPVPP